MGMADKGKILELITARREEMARRFSVKRIGLLGSYVREQAEAGSDIDLLVELEEPTFDHYMDLKFYLEDLLGTEVDLVMADAVKPRLKAYIDQEIIYA